MLVNKVHPPLLPVTADLLTSLHKAGKSLVAALSPRRDNGIVILGYVDFEKVRSGKVVSTLATSIAVLLSVVGLVVELGGEGERSVRGQEAAHTCARSGRRVYLR